VVAGKHILHFVLEELACTRLHTCSERPMYEGQLHFEPHSHIPSNGGSVCVCLVLTQPKKKTYSGATHNGDSNSTKIAGHHLTHTDMSLVSCDPPYLIGVRLRVDLFPLQSQSLSHTTIAHNHRQSAVSEVFPVCRERFYFFVPRI
jgi:hypothetical protein